MKKKTFLRNAFDFSRLGHARALRSRDLLLAVALALGWWGSLYLRKPFIRLRCLEAPLECSAESLNQWDRMSLGLEWSQADGASYFLQNASLGVAFAILLVMFGFQTTDSRSLRNRLKQVLKEWIFIWHAIALNGVINEWVRVLVQRPRPFVYKDPLELGRQFAHYTSFYSGHTSFTSVVWTYLVIKTWTHSKNFLPRVLVLCAWVLVPSLTAYFRIFSGRHFLTDTLAGGIAGSLVAVATLYLQCDRKQNP